MKVTPSIQTLILAGERSGSRSQAGNAFEKVASDEAGGSVLQRLTIVAARPDAVVYLRADYGQAEAESSGTSVIPQYQRPAGVAYLGSNRKDSFGNSASTGRDAGLSSYLKPAEQYARTQRILSTTPQAQYIDVHA